MAREKILLHACCGPCTTQVHVDLVYEGFFVSGFFYNPNIYPKEEYLKRKDSMEKYAKILDLPMTFIENDADHKPGDCKLCYEIRLLRTAQFAKANEFDAFTTTLLISPYQKHELIKETGGKIAKIVGIDFIYRDFRKEFNKSRELAAMYNLYRQTYCGCSSSIKLKGGKNEQAS